MRGSKVYEFKGRVAARPLTRAARASTIRMPAKRAMEYRTKLLFLPKCLGGSDNAATLVEANKLVEKAVNDRTLLDDGWELHDVVGLARSQLAVGTTDGEAGAGPIFALVVFSRVRQDASRLSRRSPS